MTPVWAALLLTGCSGTLYHGPAPNGPKVEGAVYYPPMSIVQQTETTTLVDSKGAVIGNRTGSGGLVVCQPIITEQVVTIRDYSSPQRIWYEPGFLEANKIGFTLNADGALLGVNTESTPDQGNTLKNLAGAAASAAALAAPPAVAASPGRTPTRVQACNNGATVIGARPFTIVRP